MFSCEIKSPELLISHPFSLSLSLHCFVNGFLPKIRCYNNSIFILISSNLEGWGLHNNRSLKDDGIILASSNYIHRHTCHVNANSLPGAEIRSQAMLCLEMWGGKSVISGPKSQLWLSGGLEGPRWRGRISPAVTQFKHGPLVSSPASSARWHFLVTFDPGVEFSQTGLLSDGFLVAERMQDTSRIRVSMSWDHEAKALCSSSEL